MKSAKVHIVASDWPIPELGEYTTACHQQIKRARFQIPSDDDLRFTSLQAMVTCRGCRQAEDPGRRYNYGAIEGAVSREAKESEG